MTSSFAYADNGWVSHRVTPTGEVSNVTKMMRCIAALGSMASIGTGGSLDIQSLRNDFEHISYWAPTSEVADVALIRTPAEDLEIIRNVFRPAISDLAAAFGVSRQSVYNWINGEAVAEDNSQRLADLARASDILLASGISDARVLLKRKFANGRTLFQVVAAGESASTAAQQLVKIYKREDAQRNRLRARFAARPRSMPTADFDLPAPNDAA